MAKKKQPSVEGIMNVFYREGADHYGILVRDYRKSEGAARQSKKLRAALKEYLKQF